MILDMFAQRRVVFVYHITLFRNFNLANGGDFLSILMLF